MSDLCVLCDRKVSSRQHAVSCAGCERWQHRLCDTGAHITRAFERLRETVTDRTPAMSQLFSYVEDTWLGNSLWAPEEWSIYRQNVRTNNDVEGWHRSSNRNGGRGGMSFYVLLKLLLEEGKMVTFFPCL